MAEPAAIIQLKETQPHLEHDGCTITVEKITPGRARDLPKMNTHNRPASKAAIAHYKRDMLNKKWKFTGDPIRISSENVIIDGQHRLAAVEESGMTQTFLMIRNMNPDSFPWIDRGKRRKGSDALAIVGAKNYNGIASSIILYKHYLDGDVKSERLNPEDHVRIYEEKPLWNLVGQMATRFYSMSEKLINKSQFGTILMLITNYHESQGFTEDEAFQLACEWVEGLASGFDLAQTDARLLVRRRAYREKFETKMRSDSIYGLVYMVKAYNYHLHNVPAGASIKLITDTKGNIRRVPVGEKPNNK